MKPHKKIREARKILGLNQLQLANILGVSQNDVSKLESGQKKFIAKCYIDFLSENDFDLNTLFKEDLKLSKIGEEEESHLGSEQQNSIKNNEYNYSVKQLNYLAKLLNQRDLSYFYKILEIVDPDMLIEYTKDKLTDYKNIKEFVEIISEENKDEYNMEALIKRIKKLEDFMAEIVLKIDTLFEQK